MRARLIYIQTTEITRVRDPLSAYVFWPMKQLNNLKWANLIFDIVHNYCKAQHKFINSALFQFEQYLLLCVDHRSPRVE